MKASEAVLLVIRDQGGQVKTTQFSEWLGRLTKAGLLSLEAEGEGESIQLFYRLTDTGGAYVNGVQKTDSGVRVDL